MWVLPIFEVLRSSWERLAACPFCFCWSILLLEISGGENCSSSPDVSCFLGVLPLRVAAEVVLPDSTLLGIGEGDLEGFECALVIEVLLPS